MIECALFWLYLLTWAALLPVQSFCIPFTVALVAGQ